MLTAVIAATTIIPVNALTLVQRNTPKVIGMQIHRRKEPKIFRSPSLRRRAEPVSLTLDNFEVCKSVSRSSVSTV